MNSENNKILAPDFDGEEMKIPKKDSISHADYERDQSVISKSVLLILTASLFLILGGLYYWFMILNQAPIETPIPVVPNERPGPEANNEPESSTAKAEVETLNTVSTSDELSAIEADLTATNLDGLNNELQLIENEINRDLE